MRSKFVSLFAALILVAACETTPEGAATTAGEGAATETTGGAAITTTAVTPEPTQPAPMAAGPAMGSQEDLVVNVGDRVFYDFDKSTLKSAAQRTLERQAAWLKQNSNVTVTIEGHADERGTREYNLALGDRRAVAARDFLVALGIDAGRIEIVSYGKERPDALGHNEAAWSQNRRGVTLVN